MVYDTQMAATIVKSIRISPELWKSIENQARGAGVSPNAYIAWTLGCAPKSAVQMEPLVPMPGRTVQITRAELEQRFPTQPQQVRQPGSAGVVYQAGIGVGQTSMGRQRPMPGSLLKKGK